MRFHLGSRVRPETSEEGRKTYRPKYCEYNNKCGDNSPNTLKDREADSMIFVFKFALIHLHFGKTSRHHCRCSDKIMLVFTPPLRAGCDIRSFLSEEQLVLIPSFPSLRQIVELRLKILVCSIIYSCMLFLRTLARSKIQTSRVNDLNSNHRLHFLWRYRYSKCASHHHLTQLSSCKL